MKDYSITNYNQVSDYAINNAFDSQIMIFSDSLSPPSEPPDIGNWFSSYVYESPLLDSNDGIDRCVFKESELEKGDFGFEDTSSKVKEDGSREIRKVETKKVLEIVECQDYVADTNNHNSKGNEWIKMARDIVVPKSLPSRMFSDQPLEEKHTPKNYNSSVQNFERSNLIDKVSEKPELKSSNINKSKNDIRLSEMLLCDEIFIKEVQEEKIRDFVVSDIHLDPNSDDTTSLKNGKIRKENGQIISQENGFISTRTKEKARQNDENCRQRTGQTKSGSLRNVEEAISTSKKSDVSAKRKVLTETTNNLQSCDTFEIARKWRCPQRSKPNLGPTLKQLQLDQWVRRV